MGDITMYNRDCKTEKDNVHGPGTQELEYKNLGALEIGSTSLHSPPKPSLPGKSTNPIESFSWYGSTMLVWVDRPHLGNFSGFGGL
jgi:hypothetical protein